LVSISSIAVVVADVVKKGLDASGRVESPADVVEERIRTDGGIGAAGSVVSERVKPKCGVVCSYAATE